MADNFEPLLSISGVEHGEFVALDIGALSKVNPDQDEPTPSQPVSVLKSLSRIRSGGERERRAAEGEMTNSAGGGESGEKATVSVHVAGDGDHSRNFHTTTPTSGWGKCRRVGRRPSSWLNPRRVLFVFATLSSMGTLILLYFTLSMGKMAGSDSSDSSNAQ
ncbi:uncharacterized protein [Typha latifolia]|uniref:uncharacterized protein n=1 Tax=Typha latifolia TaxID=4733 RepID=UPI003C2E5279